MSIREDLQSVFDDYAHRLPCEGRCRLRSCVHSGLARSSLPTRLRREDGEAVEALHREWMQLGGDDKQVSVTDAGSFGDLAWCLTAYSDAHELRTSLNVFERQANGNG